MAQGGAARTAALPPLGGIVHRGGNVCASGGGSPFAGVGGHRLAAGQEYQAVGPDEAVGIAHGVEHGGVALCHAGDEGDAVGLLGRLPPRVAHFGQVHAHGFAAIEQCEAFNSIFKCRGPNPCATQG